jgi:hypothetical protein
MSILHASKRATTTSGLVSCLGDNYTFVESEMAFRRGARREHPQLGAVTEPQRGGKAISGSTLRAAWLLAACGVARRSQIQQGYVPSSRLAHEQNSQPQMYSYFRDGTLIKDAADYRSRLKSGRKAGHCRAHQPPLKKKDRTAVVRTFD